MEQKESTEEALLDAYVLRYADQLPPGTLTEWVLRCPDGSLGQGPLQLHPACEVSPVLAERIETRLRQQTSVAPAPCLSKGPRKLPTRVRWKEPLEIVDTGAEPPAQERGSAARAASPHPRREDRTSEDWRGSSWRPWDSGWSSGWWSSAK
ncbi:unnamed protein product, partial [Effrenium voratum]